MKKNLLILTMTILLGDKTLSLKHVKANFKVSLKDHGRFHSTEPVMGHAV